MEIYKKDYFVIIILQENEIILNFHNAKKIQIFFSMIYYLKKNKINNKNQNKNKKKINLRNVNCYIKQKFSIF